MQERRKEDVFYESLIRKSPFGFSFHKIILDENGVPHDYEFLDINEAYEKITGLKKSEIAGKRISDIFSLSNIEIQNRIKIFGNVALHNTQNSYEQYSLALSKWFMVSIYSPMKHYFVCIYSDITEEKKEREKFNKFFELDLDLLCIVDSEGVFKKVNRSWTTQLGYLRKDLENIKYIDLVHPKDVENTLHIHNEILKGKKIPVFANRYRTKNGNYKLIEWRWQFYQNTFYAAARDISDQKIMEAALLREKVLLKTILNGIPDIISLQKPDHTILSYNQAGYDFLQKKPSEVDGRKCYEIIGQDLPCETCPTVGAITKKRPNAVEKYIPSMDIWLEATCIPIIENEKVVMLVEVLHNITERKNAEHEIIKAREAAEIANSFKSEFLASMSHEIRTPLNGVIGFTELLKNSGNTTGIIHEYAENAFTSAHSLLGIINDILDFSKIEAGKLELEEIKTDIIELVEQASDIIKYNIAKKNLELLLNISPVVPRFAVIDPLRLKQVLINLLGNAVKFTDSGEIEIKVNFSQTDDSQGEFFFSVRDTGIGIPEKQKSTLFQAFSQADRTISRKFGGTGLGLTISAKLLEKMGSKFELQSIEGKGSTFSFVLKREFFPGEPAPAGDIKNIKKILVMDDNRTNRLILQHTLESWGIECLTAENGIDGIEKVKINDNLDAVIIDYLMPVINGIETVTHLSKNGFDIDRTPVILLHSSSDDDVIFPASEKLKIRHKITKPVKSLDLFNILANLKNTLFKDSAKSDKSDLSKADQINKPVIMIAEDVPLNMILVKTILSANLNDPEFIEACNGLEAVEKFKIKIPDLILMDVQMPEMDGFTATRMIRKLESQNSKRCPVIALTAGAVKGRDEQCFEAGMDGFLTKPVNAKELVDTVKKYLKESLSLSAEQKSKEDQSGNTEIMLFDKETFMRGFPADQLTAALFLEQAVETIEAVVAQLKKNIGDLNAEAIRKTAHKLKGSALNMRFNAVGERARSLENMKKIEKKIAENIFSELLSDWEKTKKLIL